LNPEELKSYLQLVFDEADVNGDGCISPEELAGWLRNNQAQFQADLREAFEDLSSYSEGVDGPDTYHYTEKADKKEKKEKKDKKHTNEDTQIKKKRKKKFKKKAKKAGKASLYGLIIVCEVASVVLFAVLLSS
jgi:hypothetical protein